jgi:glutamate synthase (NADPH/NADH) small chain
MADPLGFLKIKKKDAGNRPIADRVSDFGEVEQTLNSEDRKLQASRCMDCGIPFCHWGCPVDNLIPEFSCIKGNGKKQATDCMQQITFRNLPAEYALLHVNIPVF